MARWRIRDVFAPKVNTTPVDVVDSAEANALAAAPPALFGGTGSLTNFMSGLNTSADSSWWDQWFERRPLGERQRDVLGRDPLVRRILSLPGEDATREGWAVEVEAPEAHMTQEEIAKAIADYEDRAGVNMTRSYRDALRRARQHGAALILLGIDDNRTPDQPVDITKIKRVWWSAVIDARDFDYGPVIGPRGEVSDNGTRPEDDGKYNEERAAQFGNVAYFTITDINGVLPDGIRYGCFGSNGGTSAELLNVGDLRVHADRVLYIPGPDALPALDQMQDALAAFFRSQSGLSRAVDRASLMLWKIAGNIAKSWQLDENRQIGRRRIMDAMRSMSAQSALVVDKEEEDFSLIGGGNTSGLSSVIGDHMVWLAGLSGIPITRLFGVSPGGWGTGEGERADYHDKIRDIQTSDLQPHIRKTALYFMAARDGGINLLLQPRAIHVEFEDLDPPSEAERIEMLAKKADAVVKLSGVQGLFLVSEFAQLFEGDIDLDKTARALIAERRRAQQAQESARALSEQAKLSAGAIDAVIKLADVESVPPEGKRALSVASGLRPDLAMQVFPPPPPPAPPAPPALPAGAPSPTPGGETPDDSDGEGGEPAADVDPVPEPTPARMLPADVAPARDLASEFGVPTRTITRLAEKDAIRTYYKVGGKRVFSRAEVIEAERVGNLSEEEREQEEAERLAREAEEIETEEG